MGWERGAGRGQGRWADRGAVLVLRESTNVYPLLNLESFVCAPVLVTSRLCQPKGGGGTWLPVLVFMRVLYVGAAEAGALSTAVCVTGLVISVLHVRLSVSLQYVLSFAGCTCKQESSSHIPQPGERPGVPRLGSRS